MGRSTLATLDDLVSALIAAGTVAEVMAYLRSRIGDWDLSVCHPDRQAPHLPANHAMKASMAGHVGAGKPVWAECGGMMALFSRSIDVAGVSHPMWCVLAGRVAMHTSLAAPGPQQQGVDAPGPRGHHCTILHQG